MQFGNQLTIQICHDQFLPIASGCSLIKIFYCKVFLLHSTIMQSKSRTQNFSEFVCLINDLCLRSRLLISGIILLPHHLSRSLSSGIKQQVSLIVKIFIVIRFFIFCLFLEILIVCTIVACI